MSSIPANAPIHCPGPESQNAGAASGCAGCPNQQICASGEAKAVDPSLAMVRESLETVRNKILVLSGKGGVGKSTMTAMLSRALASDPNRNVAVLDIDICGPSQPRVLGVSGEEVHQSGSGWSPVYVEDNLSLMSIGFLLPSVDDAIIWRGPKKNGMIKQFLTEVDWGQLDYLLIDTPPGTTDEHLSVVSYLSEASLTGAVIITTPQEVALLDVRKEIAFCRKMGIRILGVIENMAGFVCPKCTTQSEIFKANTGGAWKMCVDLDVPLLGSVPLDPRLARSCDEGRDFISEISDSPATKKLQEIVAKLIKCCE